MTWRERKQAASFKGVAFFVEDQAFLPGRRRVVVRRLAGRSGSVQQDLSANDEDQVSVEAFLAGDDFDLARQDLEKALASKGPGALVLPSRGELWVSITSIGPTRERRTEGGYCTLQFTAVLEDRSPQINTSPDSSGLLKKLSSLLTTIATTDFSSSFSVLAMPGKYITQVTNALSNVTQNLRVIQGKINGTLNPLEDLSAEIDNLDASVAGLLNTPDALAAKLSDVVTSVFGLADTTKDGLDRATGLSTLSDSPFERSAAVRTTWQSALLLQGLGDDQPGDATGTLADRNAKNVRAVYRLSRASALARQCETFAVAPFDSATLALEVLESISAEIDALQEYNSGDDLYNALADQRAALAAHLTQTAAQLPRTITYQPKQEIPAILLAHMLYGDARQESEIVARNRPSNPSLLIDALEVLEP
jgi:prophage DNA circulation protein